jgi:hypothetical protein
MRARLHFLISLGFAVFFILSSILVLAQTSLDQGNPCGEAILQYREDNQVFQNLSRDCHAQAGQDPGVSLDDCPSVDKDLFISLLGKLAADRLQVCQNCRATWPKKELEPGTCSGE